VGGAANAEFAGGGVANVVGGAAAGGCVAVGKRTCCARASSANIITSAATKMRTIAFKAAADQRAREEFGIPDRARRVRGTG
jgi:hypothetical protein